MLGQAFNIAASAIRAYTTNLNATSHNLANVNTVGTYKENGDAVDPDAGEVENFQPVDVLHQETEGGGVQAIPYPRTPDGTPIYDPDHPAANSDGLVQQPNVPLAEEISNLIIAQGGFEANIAVLKTADEMTETLLDIKKNR